MERDHQSMQENKEFIDSSKKQTQPSGTNNNNNNNNNNSTNDRLKRDEWSGGAVSILLETYESKWILRNRAKLKGQDWEDVAKHVSARSNNTKSSKTQTQCKNKIESMKKRYRSESAAPEATSWPLYPRLDLLLRGNGPSAVAQPSSAVNVSPVVMLEPSPPPPPPVLQPQNSNGSNGVDRVAKLDAGNNNIVTKSMDHECEKNRINDTDSSTPTGYPGKPNSSKAKSPLKKKKNKQVTKRKREERWEIGESIRWLAEVVMRSEQARMETMKEIERMTAEAEAKRGEMDLKRTEIIANTQLEIAKLFAKGAAHDSSLRIQRS